MRPTGRVLPPAGPDLCRSGRAWPSPPPGPTRSAPRTSGRGARGGGHPWHAVPRSTWRCRRHSPRGRRRALTEGRSGVSASSRVTAPPAGSRDLALELEQVGHDAVGDGKRDLALAQGRAEERTVGVIGCESGLYKDRGPSSRSEDQEGPLLYAAVFPGVHGRDLALHQLREARRLPEVFVELQVVEDESQRSANCRPRGVESE